jgi:hypothetical protein
MRNYASFCTSSGLRGLTLPRPDVIIATSPQLLVASPDGGLGSRGRCRSYSKYATSGPESLTAVGMGNENSLLHHGLAVVAHFCMSEPTASSS